MDQLVTKEQGRGGFHALRRPSQRRQGRTVLPSVDRRVLQERGFRKPFLAGQDQAHERTRNRPGVGPIDAVDEFYFNIEYQPEALPLGTATPTEKNLHHINNLWTQKGFLAKGKKQSLLWGIVRPDGGEEPVLRAGTITATGQSTAIERS